MTRFKFTLFVTISLFVAVLAFVLADLAVDTFAADSRDRALVEYRERNTAPRAAAVLFPEEPTRAMHYLGKDGAPARDVFDVLRPHRVGVSWEPDRSIAFGATDSIAECKAETDSMCDLAGHDGVSGASVEITVQEGGSGCLTCSGECTGGCNENGCPTAIITSCPDDDELMGV